MNRNSNLSVLKIKKNKHEKSAIVIIEFCFQVSHVDSALLLSLMILGNLFAFVVFVSTIIFES